MDTMTSRGRVSKAFKHEEPDRTPVFEYVLESEEMTRYVLGRPASFLHWDECVRDKGWENSVRQIAIDRLDMAEFFGHDIIYQIPNPLPDSGVKPVAAHSIQDDLDDPVEKIIARNLGKRENPPRILEDSLFIYELLHQEMKKRGIDLLLNTPAYSHGVWTDIDLMQTMLMSPETAHEHFAFATEYCDKLIDEYIRLEVDIIGIGGDFAGNNGPLISPGCYREFIMPELRKLSNKIHNAGIFCINASDGKLWNLIEDFLIGTGVDGYLEIDLHAGMELKPLKNTYGDRITLLGNMDCGNTLSFALPETIRLATVQCLRDGFGNGGHIFTASNAITDSVPVENYFAMANAYRNYFGLPVLNLIV